MEIRCLEPLLEHNSITTLLFVRTKVAKSKIHGMGLFADQFIPKGSVIWRFTEGFDLRFTAEDILAFPEILQVYMAKYSWKSKKSDLYCLASDNGKYCNHDLDPNAVSAYADTEKEVVTRAIRDIHSGEEITENYSTFEDDNGDDNVLDEIARRLKLEDEVDPRVKGFVTLESE